MAFIGDTRPSVKIYPDKFEEQVVVVTGAAQGIGEVTARLFAAQGATVVFVDVNKEKLQALFSSFASHYQTEKISFRVCDVGVEEQVNSLITEIVSTFSRLDVLVHLAGLYPSKPLLQYTVADYQRIFNVNMESCFLLTRAVLPHMQKAGYGRIINTASGTILKPEPNLSLYVAAKSAVAGFTRSTAIEAGPGITVNVIAPGLIKTDTIWNAGIQPDGSHPLFEKLVGQQIIKRFGLPGDIAHMISFIASPEAEFITGQLFDVGGGNTFH